jgi:hypothetical protein
MYLNVHIYKLYVEYYYDKQEKSFFHLKNLVSIQYIKKKKFIHMYYVCKEAIESENKIKS